MYESHDAFDPPTNPDIPIWRYMDFTKYVWLLAHEALFFSRADRLGDPFEGAYSAVNQALRPQVYGEVAQTIIGAGEFRAALPRVTVVNCWHMNEVESAAMWRLYLKSGEGVAVRSTFRRLTESFADFKPSVFVGVVRYVDYDQEWIPEAYTFSPFLHKRRSFEYERELRAMRQDLPAKDGTLDEPADVAEVELTVEPPRYGLDVEVHQSSLDADPVY